jgi:hypothetical protein
VITKSSIDSANARSTPATIPGQMIGEGDPDERLDRPRRFELDRTLGRR